MFPNAACVVSLIDRLVHRCEIVAIEGESYRLKEAKARSEQKVAARAAAPRKEKKARQAVVQGRGVHPRPAKVPPGLHGQRNGRRHGPMRYWRC